MLRKFCFIAILCLLFTLPTIAIGIELLNISDEVRVMQIESDNSFTWETYPNVQACLDHYDIDRKHDIWHAGEIVFHYDAYLSSTRFDPYIEMWVTPEPNNALEVGWRWIDYPHINYHDNSDLFDLHSHPSDYSDFIEYMANGGWIDRENYDNNAILISVDNNCQQMVDNARTAWGLDVFPDSRPSEWESGVHLSGGDWVQYGDNDWDYYITRIDIHRDHNTRTPDTSAAFRTPDTRRFSYRFDDNDFTEAINAYNQNQTPASALSSLQINYNTNLVFVSFPTVTQAESVLASIPTNGYISFAKGDKWYVARITNKLISEGATRTITFYCDPQAKKGTFTGGEVTLELSQGAIVAPPPNEDEDEERR